MKVSLRPLFATALLLTLGACKQSETTYMVGTLERDRVELKVESNEPIRGIHVRDGQEVAAGDLVLEQDPARAEAKLAQMKALRDQAAARLAELVRGPREESIREARANLGAARASRVNAAANLKRTREVFDRGLSSQGLLDMSETSFKTASAQEQAATEALERLLNGATVEELQQAEAALLAAEAQVLAATVDLERTRIHAPVAGVVDKVLFQLGERPAPGTTIAVVLDSSRAFARVYVPEQLRARMQPGDPIDVRLDGVSDSIEGCVRWVSADATFTPYFALTEHDRSRLSYLAEIDVPEASGLPSGLPLEADFPGE
ncbi:MAG: HlyD family efflux transporter periplasmic adaptor subunit [Xanthomonadales bacterium]|jgi:HlyD family secretion protein|nr:HlyD family efflux transporter periplasmic adaptor subunit [Xanthomonadales bacterium]